MTTRRRVLVTGARGFIGRHTVPELLNLGYEVHCLGRRPTPNLPKHVAQYTVDLMDEAVVTRLLRSVRPSHLLHLAWDVTPSRFWTTPDNLAWVAAGIHLYRAFADHAGERLVLAGTYAEYDWSHSLLDDRVTPIVPRSIYGMAKSSLHRLIDAAAQMDGISTASGRIFMVYGPHEARSRLIPDVMVSLLTGQPALCGAGLQERDLMHVADVARALVTLLDGDWQGPVNIASGRCVPLRDVIIAAAEMIGRPDLVQLGARPSLTDEPRRLAATTSILTDTLGFTPSYTLDQGLAMTLDWWRGQGLQHSLVD
jgi:nucleoside-diphosphate-sugar epimerase